MARPSAPGRIIFYFLITSLFSWISETAAAIQLPVKPFSARELQAVAKLRPMVADTFDRDYMNENKYLVAWIRSFDFDIMKTSQTIRKAHQWRKTSNIEKVANEDWSKFEHEFPYSIDGHDLEGRPILILKFGLWDVRKVVVAGQVVKYNLYLNRMMEIMSRKARETFNNTVETATGNRDVVDYIIVHDMHGYNLRQHGCLACIPTILTYASDAEGHYANYVELLYVVNTPRIFETVLKSVFNLLTPKSRAAFRVFGVNKDEYAASFLSIIAPEQLPLAYGGTRDKESNKKRNPKAD